MHWQPTLEFSMMGFLVLFIDHEDGHTSIYYSNSMEFDSIMTWPIKIHPREDAL